jgi:ADP-ribosylglycohydrolase
MESDTIANTDTSSDQLQGVSDRIAASLIGLSIGDALGAPVEGLENDEVELRFASEKLSHPILPYLV